MVQPQQLTTEQALSRAKKAAKKGHFALALQLYSAILQRQPNHPVAKKGLRKLQKKLPTGQLKQAQSSGPSQDRIDALINLCHSGQMERAEQSSNEILQSYPQSLVVINILGVALQRQGKLQEAVQAFDTAIGLKPDFAEAHNNRGIALKDLGQLENAVASFDKAMISVSLVAIALSYCPVRT